MNIKEFKHNIDLIYDDLNCAMDEIRCTSEQKDKMLKDIKVEVICEDDKNSKGPKDILSIRNVSCLGITPKIYISAGIVKD